MLLYFAISADTMPLHTAYKINDQHSLAIWHILPDEDLGAEALAQGLDLDELAPIHHKGRYRESIAGRLALESAAVLLGITAREVEKDEFGKPHLSAKAADISITHSSDYAAAVVSHAGPCGIDIEPVRDKLLRVSPKFLSEAELAHAAGDLDALCFYWTAKESVYKLYGRRSLIFKENIHIAPFAFAERVEGEGALVMEEGTSRYPLIAQKLGNYWLCYALTGG